MSKGDTGFRQPAAWSARPDCGPMGGGEARPAFETTHRAPSANKAPLVWRAPEGTGGPGCGARGRRQGLAAVPVGGGRAWPGFEIDRSEPQARVWRSRGRAAAHGHTKQPGPNMASNAAPGTPVGSEAITSRRAARAGTGRGSG